MENIVLKELKLATNLGLDILLILIRCLLTLEKVSWQDISGQETIITIFFMSMQFLVLEILAKGTEFNDDYFIHGIFPGSYNEKRGISRKKGFPVFSVHMDNSMCYNGHKVSEKLAQRSIDRTSHPPYSPGISSCDFWFFEMPTHNMKDQEFQSQQVIVKASAKS
jgi:hypothetical protein